MKETKRYIVIFFSVTFLGMLFVAGVTFIIDPFFQYHMPWFNGEPNVYDERYQNPGLAKNYEYDAIITGSSMSENFNASWFDTAYNINTIKLTYSGASMKDVENAITMATNNRDVKYVFSNIDMEMLSQEFGKETTYIPEYLYDNNFFNDVKYLLNKEVLFENTYKAYIGLVNKYEGNIKNAYAWYERKKEEFEGDKVVNSVGWGGLHPQDIDYDVDNNTKRVVASLKEIIKNNKNTTFVFFYSPYSILMYYKYINSGSIGGLLGAYKYSMSELLECENVQLYFPTTEKIISDLDSYKDLGHYDLEIQYLIFEQIRDGKNRLTIDNYEKYMDSFEEMVLTYDYKALIDKYTN